MKISKIIALLVLLSLPNALRANDDAGLIVDVSTQKSFNKKASLEFEVGFRSRNSFRTADRVSLGLSGSYKLTKWLKMDAGYQLLIDNNAEKITYNDPMFVVDDDGNRVANYNNWRPSYWGLKHRVFVSLTGSYKIRRVTLSLRERWRYTYRPEKPTTRYDFDNQWWEDVTVRSKNQHVLRSRLKLAWNIPKCKFSPWGHVELFNDLSLNKVRYSLGTDYSLKKKHEFSLYYRYQRIYDKDEEEPNIHSIGLGYKFKF